MTHFSLRIFTAILALGSGYLPLNAAEDYRYACQNAGSGGYESFPDVCRMQDGRLMMVFYAGYSHIALPNINWPNGSRVVYVISEDEGYSWSEPKTVVDTPKDDRDPSITQLRDGRLVCSFFTYPDRITWLVWSSDAGRTWSNPQMVAGANHGVSSPVRELNNGRLILGIYWEPEPPPEVAHGATIYSNDGGKTWSSPAVIDNLGLRLDAETDIIELKDGSLFAAQRGGSGAQMHFAGSEDRGQTWSPSFSSGFTAHCPYFHRLHDNTILLAVREFGDGPLKGATTLRLSLDECKTWSDPVLVDARGGSYPSMVNLKDGSVLIAYYEEKAGADICVRKFRVDNGKITFIPWNYPPIPIGSRRELFIDRLLIDRLSNTGLKLHVPQAAGTALALDKPWEGIVSGYVTVFQDGSRFLMYYRGRPTTSRLDGSAEAQEVACAAMSSDGIQWNRPKLGLHEVCGTRDNNVILVEPKSATHNFSPFLDLRPNTPPAQRFKAVGGTGNGLYGFVSSNGLHWAPATDKPLITKGNFDSQNIVFWSEHELRYLCYFRTAKNGVRWVSRSTSADFLTWSDPEEMVFDFSPAEHIYINQTLPYFRAPHIYLGLAARFNPGRRALTDDQIRELDLNNPRNYGGLMQDDSDAVLLSSRGGSHYQRTFLESFIRPGLDPRNWVARANYPALGLVQTGNHELSLFVLRHYGQPSIHIERMTLRLDGFSSLHASYAGGEMVTKPLIFSGKQMELNFSTSAAGYVRIELQDETGSPVPGYALSDCKEIIGDQISRTVQWRNGHDLGSLAGKPIRVRFALKDADLYSFRFFEK